MVDEVCVADYMAVILPALRIRLGRAQSLLRPNEGTHLTKTVLRVLRLKQGVYTSTKAFCVTPSRANQVNQEL